MTTLTIPAAGPARCGNCDWHGDADACPAIQDVQERLDAGATVPCGECPACGALAYLTDKAGRIAQAADEIFDVLEDFALRFEAYMASDMADDGEIETYQRAQALVARINGTEAAHG